ncbi:MAG TPA: phage tail sheath C-terminal domain-containing protein [Thermoanaerobaculia bacterium]
MATTVYKTPGVYVREETAFPPSVIGVQTAIPAFIGYTEKAAISGKPVYRKAIPIASMVEFEAVFGKDYPAQFDVVHLTDSDEDKALIAAGDYDFKVYDPIAKKEKYYQLKPATNSEFNLYNSMRLFYANGGGDCYVVSVGSYVDEAGQAREVAAVDLQAGLDVIKEQVGPTMLVIPDAVLLPNTGNVDEPWISTAFKAVAEAMVKQCEELQDRVAVLDVYGTQYIMNPQVPGTITGKTDAVIKQFRKDVDGVARNYAMAYFPFLETSVVPLSEFTYMNTSSTGAPSSFTRLKEILSWERENLYGTFTADDGSRAEQVQKDIDLMEPTNPVAEVTRLNQNLTNALPLLLDIERVMVEKNDELPPSGAMAGVYTRNDLTKGVWNAPANVSLASVERPTVKLDNKQQEDLNVPVDGKAVNAIREFQNRGTIVWGARTLDGNSNDYRYIQVRRTLVYIEQSIKAALDRYVFAPNDGNTWTTVVATITSFLQGVWSQGGLMGSTPSEAFTVECGVGSTMTGQDVLDGIMKVQVTLQMIHPAEFIVLTFKQQMQGVG